METLSSYELIRQENIQRNATFLANIGLSSAKVSVAKVPVDSKKRKQRGHAVVVDVSANQFKARRSSRIAEILPVRYDDKAISQIIQKVERDDKRRESSSDDIDEENDSSKVYKKRPRDIANSSDHFYHPVTAPRPEASSDSSRAVSARLSVFLGDMLGVPIGDFGKAAVMAMAFNGSAPKFNKYSGVVEWSNCMFLWVNIATKGGEYSNDFLDDGRFITWYGGSKMHKDSDVVHRLLRAGARTSMTLTSSKDTIKNESGDDTSDDCVILFVRGQDESNKKPENYRCLGRLYHREYNLDVNPVTVTWELAHFDRLKKLSSFLDLIRT